MTANRDTSRGFRVYDYGRKLYLHAITPSGAQWTSCKAMARTYRHRETAALVAERYGFTCVASEPDVTDPTAPSVKPRSYRRNNRQDNTDMADKLAAALGMEVHYG